jgi:hypothetical protein
MFMAELSHEFHELTRITFRHAKSLIQMGVLLPPKPGFSENCHPVICAGGFGWWRAGGRQQIALADCTGMSVRRPCNAPMAFINGNRECPAHSWQLSRRMESRENHLNFPGNQISMEKFLFKKTKPVILKFRWFRVGAADTLGDRIQRSSSCLLPLLSAAVAGVFVCSHQYFLTGAGKRFRHELHELTRTAANCWRGLLSTRATSTGWFNTGLD